eukprot:TRINITY_DN6066_c0_g1_i1.p1 TRINITY_DN6066_c0_g1~~TRINITY_DN6066_c0_g1_i1.p1  ORF type:complete len:355 (+),score=21.34 TRINITY_DN6066_c0_g1_i1:95-1159(+)
MAGRWWNGPNFRSHPRSHFFMGKEVQWMFQKMGADFGNGLAIKSNYEFIQKKQRWFGLPTLLYTFALARDLSVTIKTNFGASDKFSTILELLHHKKEHATSVVLSKGGIAFSHMHRLWKQEEIYGSGAIRFQFLGNDSLNLHCLETFLRVPITSQLLESFGLRSPRSGPTTIEPVQKKKWRDRLRLWRKEEEIPSKTPPAFGGINSRKQQTNASNAKAPPPVTIHGICIVQYLKTYTATPLQSEGWYGRVMLSYIHNYTRDLVFGLSMALVPFLSKIKLGCAMYLPSLRSYFYTQFIASSAFQLQYLQAKIEHNVLSNLNIFAETSVSTTNSWSTSLASEVNVGIGVRVFLKTG